eukprot:TRINITY_DN19046_c0_g1_i1.p1 TRINITY_DN19046_c0_g1~~TRINITY_DN19046_c0_g1_i1.p1  ORF type:complete len:512 (+),score=64.73 TRINITY_DN19046_c0_g1_i1:95-1630(+)
MIESLGIKIYAAFSVVVLLVGGIMSLVEWTRPKPLHLVKMTDELGKGAVCLDGSPAGYYHRKGNSRLLHIHFEGGGWCYDEEDCLHRSKSNIGSSNEWANRMSQEGMLADSCNKNPTLCESNLVYIPYCDGGSFTGRREEPITYKGKDLHFKGYQIVISVLKYILRDGYLNATRVLLSGDSAGGLAVELNANLIADWIKENSPYVEKVAVLVSSGFFPLIPNAAGEMTYPLQIQNVYKMNQPDLNTTKCTFMGTDDEWRCMFAQHVIPHIDHPLFLVESKVDAWGINCIHSSSLPKDFPNGTKGDFCASDLPVVGTCSLDTNTCTNEAVKDVNSYMTNFESLVLGTGLANKTGNGLFLHTCKTHSSLIKGRWYPYMKIGIVSMQDAILYWLRRNLLGKLESEWVPGVFIDGCLWNEYSQPRNCNPSCGDDFYPSETGISKFVTHIYHSFLDKNPVFAAGIITFIVGVFLMIILLVILACQRVRKYQKLEPEKDPESGLNENEPEAINDGEN